MKNIIGYSFIKILFEIKNLLYFLSSGITGGMMNKEKIAISISQEILDMLDSKIDGHLIRNRSQAIEFFIEKGLKDYIIDKAVILLSKEHQKYALKEINGKPLIKHQIDFFIKYNVMNIFILTQHTEKVNEMMDVIGNSEANVRIFEKEVKGNAKALDFINEKLKGNSFIVMSGDTYNEFDLTKMIEKHLVADKLITMGLMSRDKPDEYGAVILDGDMIIDFKEKDKKADSHIVNAGIYIFKPEVLNFIGEKADSLEKDVFPAIAKVNQLVGFFTHGKYIHVSEER